ncbi:MAG: ornithine--oxo-acid transaminase [Polyangia bacterium]|jgi:ornithine--oxo-acid transaminase|nr:ornithine--oxo-acid transaminase [Polyangia bacterium]
MSSTEAHIELNETYGAHNYHPLPVVISKAEGVWVYDVEGRRYMDCLAAYSAVNQGHCHPRIVKALTEQAARCTLTSRAFHNDQLGGFCKELAEFCGKDQILPMNTGAEAVETAIKLSRRWGYDVKGIPDGEAEIVVCAGNFHGRTTTIVGFSTEEAYRRAFGPFTPGFVVIPYGDDSALEAALGERTCAFLVEPVQGEAGVVVPPPGFLMRARKLCQERNVLLVADEIQSGFGRTGRRFACDHEGVVPDIYILGKALSGGFYPVSAVAADRALMGLFKPGEHGSTYGGNPLAAAVGREALKVLVEERLAERSAELGSYLLERLKGMKSPHIALVRGLGLWIGVVLKPESGGARRFCEALMKRGMLCKETHDHVIRIAPPLVIERSDVDWAYEQLEAVLLAP